MRLRLLVPASFLRWLALAALALVAPAAAQPEKLPILPWSTPIVRTWKSEVTVGSMPKFYWIDNDTVLFIGRPMDRSMSEKQSWDAVRYVTQWHLPTNTVKHGFEADGRLCYSRKTGAVKFVTYQRTDGIPDVRRGTFVPDHFFGTLEKVRKLEAAERGAYSKGIDEESCEPAKPDPPRPGWLDTKKYHSNRVRSGWIILANALDESPAYCDDSTASQLSCSVLPYPRGTQTLATPVEHVDGYVLDGAFGSVTDAYLALLRGGRIEGTWRIPPAKSTGSPKNWVYTRVGVIEVTSRAYRRNPDTKGGLYHVRGAERVRLRSEYVRPSYGAQSGVSPDGCKIAYAASETLHVHTFTARVTAVCED